MGKRIDVSELPPVVGTLYPSQFDATSRARERTKLGDAAGLSQFSVNLLKLPPIVWCTAPVGGGETRQGSLACSGVTAAAPLLVLVDFLTSLKRVILTHTRANARPATFP